MENFLHYSPEEREREKRETYEKREREKYEKEKEETKRAQNNIVAFLAIVGAYSIIGFIFRLFGCDGGGDW